MDGTDYSTLFSRMLLGQGSASGSAFGLQTVVPITRCTDECGSLQGSGGTPVKSIDLSLDGQDWLWNIAERGWN